MVDLGELARKLQIKPGHPVAVVNAPPECAVLTTRAAGVDPDHAAAVIGFAAERADLALLTSVYAAAHAGRLAWITYPKSGRLDTICTATGLREPFADMAFRLPRT